MYALAAAMVLLAHLLFLRLPKKKKANAVSRNYDVFLSFRGRDTPIGFADFFFNSLAADGIRLFREEDELRFGEQIGPGLSKAIRNSRIAIPIISKDYARSGWCLRELAEIMDCHRKLGQSVFPIFYKVDVVDVGRQSNNFEEALREHEREYSSEEVLKWREALTSVARIKGWTFIADGREVKLVEMVRRKVSSELKRMWIERLPMIIRSAYLHLLAKKRQESNYQVFLAFHGPDTRYGLAAYLYTSLVAAGIRVFDDNDPSLIGKDVAHEIHNAIIHSKISIPILSENYTSSRWCLNDLAQIVDCKRKGQKILPIFYKVQPSQVQEASLCLPKHLLQLEEAEDESTYERWERALREVGSCKDGWELEQIPDGHEGVLVKQVVQEISRLLTNPQKHDPQSPSTEY